MFIEVASGRREITDEQWRSAHKAFITDDVFRRDRERYDIFGNMPLSLQVWWVDRAAAILSAAENLN